MNKTKNISFKPSHKFILMTSRLPVVSDDVIFFERLKIIPFHRKFKLAEFKEITIGTTSHSSGSEKDRSA